MRTALLLLFVALSGEVEAQTCIGRPDHFRGPSVVGDAGNGTKAYGPIVPVGEVWLVEAASISSGWNVTEPNTEWMLEIIEPITEENGRTTADDPEGTSCCWRIGLQKQMGSQATPVIALTRSVVLRAGQRMAARHNQDGHAITLLGVMWRFPAECGSALVLGGGR